MSCEELLRRLTEYQEGVLPPELCAEIERHVAGCGDCSALEQDLADLARICRSCDPPRLPDDVRRRIAERLKG
jgi:hypothetical protein